MIEITIASNNIHMTGHACRKGADGIDRACAGVSALTCNLINSLRDLTGDRIRAGTATTVGIDGSFSKDVTLDTAAPVIKSITLTPNPVDCGKTFVIAVEITD